MIKAIRELKKIKYNIFFQLHREVYTPAEFDEVLHQIFEPEDYDDHSFHGPFLNGNGNIVVVRESNLRGGIVDIIELSDDDVRAIDPGVEIRIEKNTAHISHAAKSVISDE